MVGSVPYYVLCLCMKLVNKRKRMKERQIGRERESVGLVKARIGEGKERRKRLYS